MTSNLSKSTTTETLVSKVGTAVSLTWDQSNFSWDSADPSTWDTQYQTAISSVAKSSITQSSVNKS
jgi:hypothetical protein